MNKNGLSNTKEHANKSINDTNVNKPSISNENWITPKNAAPCITVKPTTNTNSSNQYDILSNSDNDDNSNKDIIHLQCANEHILLNENHNKATSNQ